VSRQKTVWITGATGLIGGYLTRLVPKTSPTLNVIALSRDQLDLTDFTAVTKQFQNERPDLVLHLAALSASPACEQNPALAQLVNVEVTRHLANLSADIPFVLLSTDQVFDGLQGDYREHDTVHPRGVYGTTKIEAERAVLANSRHAVVRTSLNAGLSTSGRRAFNEQLTHAWDAGQTPTLFDDEFRNPIPASVTARVVWHLALRSRTGIFHVAGAERLSRWQIGELLAQRRSPRPAPLRKASLREYQGPARSPDTTLNCEKIQSELPFELPKFSQWLESHPDPSSW